MLRKLDRIARFDERSRKFGVRAIIEQKKPRSYTWALGTRLDQLSEGKCAGFAFAHEIAAKPVMRLATPALADKIYARAVQIDEFPGEANDGTSVLAAVKAASEFGYYSEYRWGFGLDDVLLAVSRKGPGVAGINWYESCDNPDDSGLIRVTGNIRGGHAILVRGVNIKREIITLSNSWGPSWGRGGDCALSFKDFERLLHEDGEFCIPIRRTKVSSLRGKQVT